MARWLVLALLAASPAWATSYTWEASCTERIYVTYEETFDLGCDEPIRGTLIIIGPADLWFTMADPDLGTMAIHVVDSVSMEIDDAGNIGYFSIGWPSGHLTSGWELMTEWRVNDSLQIRPLNMVFTRVPEPGTLWLMMIAWALLLARRFQAVGGSTGTGSVGVEAIASSESATASSLA